MATQIQHRRDTAANWTTANPVLASGEFGVEKDTGKFKIGDGTTAWSSLAYFASGGGSSAAPLAVMTRQGSISGTLTGTLRYPIRTAATITELSATLGTAPGTNPVTVQVLKNGVSIGTVSIAVGANLGTTTVSVAAAVGDYLTVNVTAGDAAAADLVVEVKG